MTGTTPLQRWLRRALWLALVLQCLYVARFFLLYFFYGLTGDDDPDAVLQLGHLGRATFLLPAIMLPGQWPEFVVLLALASALVALRFLGRRRGDRAF